MAKDGDDKGFDEHTRIGGAPPKLPGQQAPAAPPAETPAKPAPPPAPSGLDEHTRIGVAPPKLPGTPPAAPATPRPAAPPLDESTRLAATPPPTPKAPAAPATTAAPSAPSAPTTKPVAPAPPPAGGGDFTEHTILLSDLQKEFVPPARLQRMAPPGRSDIINLDRMHYLMGRLPSCDLRLYSQTASREHAELTVRDGRWYLTPVAGKAVLVNGTQVKEEVPLIHKMRLQLGGDELLFLDESGATSIEEAPRASVATVAAAGHRWLALVIALVALALVLWLWATR